MSDRVTKKIAVLPGDGIGPEVVAQALKVLKALEEKYGHDFELGFGDIGGIAIDKTGSPLPPETVEIAEKSDAVLLGAVGMPKYDNNPNARVRPEQGLLGIRKALDLYLNVRPVTVLPSMAQDSVLKPEVISNVDFTIYRELSSGIYFGDKQEVDESADERVAWDVCKYTEKEVRRILKRAFKAARTRRGELCVVDKANVLASSRLWRKTAQSMAEKYDDVKVSYMFVDNAAMQLVLNPGQFDVIATSNMFGDILSDLASAMAGSLGMLPSASLGGHSALFEPVHGSYPQAAGKDIANPLATILSVQLMMEYFGLYQEGRDIQEAIKKLLAKGIGTPDMHPEHEYGCAHVGDILSYIIADGDFEMRDNRQGQGASTII